VLDFVKFVDLFAKLPRSGDSEVTCLVYESSCQRLPVVRYLSKP